MCGMSCGCARDPKLSVEFEQSIGGRSDPLSRKNKTIAAFHDADRQAAGQALEDFAASLSTGSTSKPAQAAAQQTGQNQDGQGSKGSKTKRFKASSAVSYGCPSYLYYNRMVHSNVAQIKA
eukprot:842650-Amphidinium_carterae.1